MGLLATSCNSLCPPAGTPNPKMSMHENTLAVDSSISQDHPKTLSPGRITSDESGGAPRPLEPTVPPSHDHRTLILCFDGIGM